MPGHLISSRNMRWARIFAAFLILGLAAFLVLLEAGMVRRVFVVPGPFTGAESSMKTMAAIGWVMTDPRASALLDKAAESRLRSQSHAAVLAPRSLPRD